MKHLFVDMENVQPSANEIKMLEGKDDIEITFFMGKSKHRENLNCELLASIALLQHRARFVEMNHAGKNALDFLIAFTLGALLVHDKNCQCIIISGDTGYDPLINHIMENGCLANRLGSVSEVFGVPCDSSNDYLGKHILRKLSALNCKPKTPKGLKNFIRSTVRSSLGLRIGCQSATQIYLWLRSNGYLMDSGDRVIYLFGH